MVDTARYPSRRTIVKAGLWAAPAVAVVNLTSMSAAHASIAASCYPSHGILVWKFGSGTTLAYYAFKFGSQTALQPYADVENNGQDLRYLKPIYAPLVGYPGDPDTPAGQSTEWSVLQTEINKYLSLYSSGSVGGYAYYGPTTYLGATLVAAYSFQGNVYTLVPFILNSSDPLIFTSC